MLWLPFASQAAEQAPAAHQALGRELLRELIDTDTTPDHGSTTVAAELMAKRFLAAGFDPADVQVLGDNPLKRNLVVRLRGRGEREPILLLAHLDVVEARREDWHFDPYKLTEDGGYFYGRGTSDIKGGAAGLVATLLRLRQEGVVPRGDYVLALTAGEEDGGDNGVQWLLAHRPELDQGAVFPQRRWRRAGDPQWQTRRAVGGNRGEGLPQLHPHRAQPGRPQFAAHAGQRHLPARAWAGEVVGIPVPAAYQFRHARVLTWLV